MRYFKNTSWLFMEKVLRMGVGLFVGIWVARYLGPEQFGLLSYAQSFVGLFTAIATLGLDGIVVRELVKHPEKESEFVGTAFWLKLAGALGVLLLLAIAVNFTSNDHYTNLLVFIIASATIFQSFNVVDIYFQSRVLSRYVVYANLIGLFVSSLVKIALILNEAPLVAFAWVVLFDSFVLACGYLYFYFKHSALKIKNLTFKKEVAVSLLKDSWPLILSGVVVSVYMKIDQVMIKEMIDSKAVGEYAAAVRLSESWYFISGVITMSVFPAIINAKKYNHELYFSRLQKLYIISIWIAIFIASLMSYFSSWIISFLYGDEYTESVSVLIILAWAGVFVFAGLVCSRYLLLENLNIKSLYRSLLGVLFNILLNIKLIPMYGINGAAVATLLSQLIVNYIYDLFDKDLHSQLRMKTNSIFFIISKFGAK